MSRWRNLPALALASMLVAASAAGAGIVVYEEGDKKLEIGGRIQLQYLDVDTGGSALDENLSEVLAVPIADCVGDNILM